RNKRYLQVINETIVFIKEELMHEKGGFFAALDADSEGVEGKYYIWSHEEVQNLLGDDAALFCEYYNITPAGNWEHTNILRVLVPLDQFAENKGISVEVLGQILSKGRQVLKNEREKRVTPGLDDTIMLGWNALMNTAYSKAYQATGNATYLNVAIRNMQFVCENMISHDVSF